jgi:hypothetical protein
MNRSITRVGVAVILGGLALVASPIALTGAEQFNFEQAAGIFITPIGLLVVLIGAVQPNPERTTVGGTFGNPEVDRERPTKSRSVEPTRAYLGFNPREPVHCRYCRTLIAFDLALCPRCGRPRECRRCGRPLEIVGDRTDCPGCHRAEALCDCARVARGTPEATVAPSRRRPL